MQIFVIHLFNKTISKLIEMDMDTQLLNIINEGIKFHTQTTIRTVEISIHLYIKILHCI